MNSNSEWLWWTLTDWDTNWHGGKFVALVPFDIAIPYLSKDVESHVVNDGSRQACSACPQFLYSVLKASLNHGMESGEAARLYLGANEWSRNLATDTPRTKRNWLVILFECAIIRWDHCKLHRKNKYRILQCVLRYQTLYKTVRLNILQNKVILCHTRTTWCMLIVCVWSFFDCFCICCTCVKQLCKN